MLNRRVLGASGFVMALCLGGCSDPPNSSVAAAPSVAPVQRASAADIAADDAAEHKWWMTLMPGYECTDSETPSQLIDQEAGAVLQSDVVEHRNAAGFLVSVSIPDQGETITLYRNKDDCQAAQPKLADPHKYN